MSYTITTTNINNKHSNECSDYVEYNPRSKQTTKSKGVQKSRKLVTINTLSG